jgi:L-aminoadipate-semialdehyde dehydrogenase
LGDLAKPRLGLAESDFVQLGKKVQAIYHNGAMVCSPGRAGAPPSTPFLTDLRGQVHWVFPYEKLKATNVQSTVDCLLLAAVGPTLGAPAVPGRAAGVSSSPFRVVAPVHFISSTSVFDSEYYVGLGEKVSENDDLAGGVGLVVGYGGAPRRAAPRSAETRPQASPSGLRSGCCCRRARAGSPSRSRGRAMSWATRRRA